MVKCPFCGYEGEFREVRAPWQFGFYTVRMLKRPRCHGVFNYYHGISLRSSRVSEFTIKIKPKGRMKRG
jgi:hypothetical protein